MALAIGTQLGSMEVTALIGRGGMGEVYRARDTKLKREVAIKVLPDEFSRDAERVSRFQREAEVLASLNHPNIAAIYDLQEAHGSRYLVLELVEGETLADRIARGPISIEEALDIAKNICEALEAAHEKGIIHRDLKPANVKITPDGKVKVLDFGIAKILQSEASADSAVTVASLTGGVVMGTPAYMSPQQAKGQNANRNSDVWAFGCVLYEMLTGCAVFKGETVSEILVGVLKAEPDWQRLPVETPVPIRRLLRRCLQKDHRERLQHIGDARIEINEEKNESGIDADRTQSVPQQKPRRTWLPWIAVAGLAVSVGVWEARRPSAAIENPLANAQFTRLTDFQGSESDAAISRDGKFVAFASDRDGPFDLWSSQIGTGRFTNLTQGKVTLLRLVVWNLGFSADGSEIWLSGAKDIARLQLIPLSGGTPRAFLSDHVANVNWSADGARLVYHTFDPGDPMFVADRSGANAKQIFVNPTSGGHNHFPTFSPDGRWIYFVAGVLSTSEMDLYRISVTGGQPERLTHHNNNVKHPVLIDPRTVLYLSPAEDGSGPWLWALHLESKMTRRVSFGLEKYTSLAASADGHRLVATVANPTSNLWSIPIRDRPVEEREVKPFPVPSVRALAPRFGATSLFYLSSRGAGDGLWRYQDGQALEIWKGADGPLLEPSALSSDGRRATLVLRRNGRRRLQMISTDGAELQSLAEAIDVQGAASWSPDGKWIVTGGSDGSGPGLFKIPADGGKPVRLTSDSAFNPVWSPDDSLIVYAGPVVSLYAPLLAVRPDGTRVEFPPIRLLQDGERCRFLPDGKRIVYMQGLLPPQDFWLLDVETKQTHQITHFNSNAAMRTFDITPDGKQIVFDRLRDNSDVVLIELPR